MPPRRSRTQRLGPWVVRGDRVIALRPNAEEDFTARPKLKAIVKAIGLSPTADILDVDKSQLNRSLELFDELGEDYGCAQTTRSFGTVALDVDRDFDQARRWYDGAIPLMRRRCDFPRTRSA